MNKDYEVSGDMIARLRELVGSNDPKEILAAVERLHLMLTLTFNPPPASLHQDTLPL